MRIIIHNCYIKDCCYYNDNRYKHDIDRENVRIPDTRVDLLIKLLSQNKGKLSEIKRQKNFEELSEEKISIIKDYYVEIFEK